MKRVLQLGALGGSVPVKVCDCTCQGPADIASSSEHPDVPWLTKHSEKHEVQKMLGILIKSEFGNMQQNICVSYMFCFG